jgi:hypothetical protein
LAEAALLANLADQVPRNPAVDVHRNGAHITNVSVSANEFAYARLG